MNPGLDAADNLDKTNVHSRESSLHLLNLGFGAETDIVKDDLQIVEAQLESGLRSTLRLPKELGERVVRSGGKRIRPYLMCVTYRSSLLNPALKARATEADLHTLAAVAEWVHTATLFHDDVLDNSPLRRNQATAHTLHGNKVAILVGDFVYVEAFALLMERGLLDPSRELAHTIKALVEGELLQHQEVQQRGLNFETYERIALAKTAALFEWCTWTGAWAAGFENLKLARNLGRSLGYAFQLIDDVIDTFEIDPRTCSDEVLIEWIESSAPFPIVVLSQSEICTQELWDKVGNASLNLSDKRSWVAELQLLARSNKNQNAITQLINQHLAHSAHAMKELGGHPMLSAALEIMKGRAENAYQLLQVNTES